MIFRGRALVRFRGWRNQIGPRFVSCLVLVVLCTLLAHVDLRAKRIEPFKPKQHPSIPADPGVSISTGESFNFYVSAYGITAGNLHWSLDRATYRDKPALRVRLKGGSVGIANLIGRVRGTLTSYVDPDGGYSLGYELSSSRRTKSEPFTTHFDYEEKLFVASDGETGALNGPTHDVLSMLLYLRTRSLRPDRTLELSVQEGDSVEQVHVQVVKRARIATYAGWFDALECEISKVEPQNKPSGEGQRRDLEPIGQLWISDDERRIPLYITYPTRYGNVNAILHSYHLNA